MENMSDIENILFKHKICAWFIVITSSFFPVALGNAFLADSNDDHMRAAVWLFSGYAAIIINALLWHFRMKLSMKLIFEYRNLKIPIEYTVCIVSRCLCSVFAAAAVFVAMDFHAPAILATMVGSSVFLGLVAITKLPYPPTAPGG